MVDPKLHDRRGAVLKRCSSNGQVDNSIKNQNLSVERTIADNSITVIKEIDLEGVTGSVPGARDDIDKLIELKRGGLDFDLLIVPNVDRFYPRRAGAWQQVALGSRRRGDYGLLRCGETVQR